MLWFVVWIKTKVPFFVIRFLWELCKSCPHFHRDGRQPLPGWGCSCAGRSSRAWSIPWGRRSCRRGRGGRPPRACWRRRTASCSPCSATSSGTSRSSSPARPVPSVTLCPKRMRYVSIRTTIVLQLWSSGLVSIYNSDQRFLVIKNGTDVANFTSFSWKFCSFTWRNGV